MKTRPGSFGLVGPGLAGLRLSPGGIGVTDVPRRRNRTQQGNDPGALAKQLPEELRNFGTYTDMDKRRNDIVRWIDTQRPRQGSTSDP
jgi:hypothetical protein